MNVQPVATSYIDDIVLRDRDTTGTGTLDERLYAMQDANWNVVAVATPAAVIQERYAYSPYGVPVFLTGTFTARTSSSYNWDRLFTGQTYDTQTGLHYFRNRMLHSQVGTFITRDPIGYADGLHLYRAWFVPNRVDPRGLECADAPTIPANPLGNGTCVKHTDSYGEWNFFDVLVLAAVGLPLPKIDNGFQVLDVKCVYKRSVTTCYKCSPCCKPRRADNMAKQTDDQYGYVDVDVGAKTGGWLLAVGVELNATDLLPDYLQAFAYVLDIDARLIAYYKFATLDEKKHAELLCPPNPAAHSEFKVGRNPNPGTYRC